MPNEGQNYTKTKDPNVYIGKYGVPITRDQFVANQKSSLPFSSFEDYANYVGGWAKQLPQADIIHPYYRVYANQNIPGGDIALLQAKYHDNPQVQAILTRNIAKDGEVPQFASQDGDTIRQLIAKEKADAADPNAGLHDAFMAARK